MEVEEWRNVGPFTGHMVAIEGGRNSSAKIFGYVTSCSKEYMEISKGSWKECGFNNTIAVINNGNQLFVCDPLYKKTEPVTIRDMTLEEVVNLYTKIKDGSMHCEKPYYYEAVMEELKEASLPKGENIKG